jgi:hypothetical protein
MLHTKIIQSEEELARIDEVRNTAIEKIEDKIIALTNQSLEIANSEKSKQAAFRKKITLCTNKINELTMSKTINMDDVLEFLESIRT